MKMFIHNLADSSIRQQLVAVQPSSVIQAVEIAKELTEEKERTDQLMVSKVKIDSKHTENKEIKDSCVSDVNTWAAALSQLLQQSQPQQPGQPTQSSQNQSQPKRKRDGPASGSGPGPCNVCQQSGHLAKHSSPLRRSESLTPCVRG